MTVRYSGVLWSGDGDTAQWGQLDMVGGPCNEVVWQGHMSENSKESKS